MAESVNPAMSTSTARARRTMVIAAVCASVWTVLLTGLLAHNVAGRRNAQTIAADGLSQKDVRQFLYDHVTLSLDDLKPGKEGGEGFGTALLKMGSDKGFVVGDRVRKFRSPDSIFVVVAGGTAGRFSVAIPGWVADDLGSTPVTKHIQVD